MATQRTPAESDGPPPRLSRWRAAWRVLKGEPLVPEQILQDWLSYRLLFDDLLKRFGALLARQAKADHARLREQLQDEPTHRAPPTAPKSRKEEVRRRAAEMRGLATMLPARNGANRVAAVMPPPSLPLAPEVDDEPEEEDDAP